LAFGLETLIIIACHHIEAGLEDVEKRIMPRVRTALDCNLYQEESARPQLVNLVIWYITDEIPGTSESLLSY
jgi:hypothetical protein